MNVWERITGNDLTRAFKAFEARAQTLPPDYEGAWQKIKTQLWSYGDFSGRNLLPIFDSVLGLLEESALDGLAIEEVLGEDLHGFCAALVGHEGAKSVRDRWREQLNQSIAKKLGIKETP